MRKISLAEQLAELATPAPREERDPLDDMNDEDRAMESDAELEEMIAHNKGTERGRMRADISLEHEDYRGRKSSRKAVFEQSTAFESEAGASSGSDVDDLEALDEDGARRVGRVADDLDLGDDDASEGDSESGRSESDAGSDGEDEDGDAARRRHSFEMEAGTTGIDEEDEMAALEREYAQMQATEADAASRAAATAQAESELTKARAVANQMRVWEHVLGVRIMLQRSLTASQRLPGEVARAAVRVHSGDVDAAYAECVEACSGAVADLLDLQDALLDRHPGVTEAASTAGVKLGKRKRRAESNVEDLWSEMESLEKKFAPYRDESLDRWHRKTMLATGKMAMKSQLKALNQSLSQQVAIMMRDPTRAITRSQLPLATRPQPLCELQPSAVPESNAVADGDNAAGEAATSNGVASMPGRALDANTYDDADFYQLLLKEFLEAANVDGATLSAVRATKTRKIVDRRASKGRKIRYHVIDKLVNFMTPTLSQNDEMIQNIFSNLFGRGSAA